MVKAKSVEKTCFKARKMPNFCKPGKYYELIEEKLFQQKLRKEYFDQKMTSGNKKPYYKFMPKRFQEYEMYKIKKQELLQNRSLEDIDPNCTFKPDINPNRFGMDFKKYFSELQFKFQEKLNSQKVIIRQNLENNACKKSAKLFVSNFNNRHSKHICPERSDIRSLSCGKKGSVKFKSSTLPIFDHIELKKNLEYVRSRDKLHENCFPKESKKFLERVIEKNTGFVLNPRSNSGDYSMLNRKIIKREEEMDRDEFEECRFQKEYRKVQTAKNSEINRSKQFVKIV